jgi:hypothetical protein
VVIERTVAYLGPSLSRREAADLLTVPVEFRPPVRRGDLDALESDVSLVCMVDGVFHSTLAVSVREVAKALKRGVRVIGCSSMGALRAAELKGHGMSGLGAVFEMYVSGEIDSDAEVALVFHPDSHKALTEPLVNVRYAMRRAAQEHVVDASVAECFVRLASKVYYFDRTYRLLFKKATGVIAADDLARLERYLMTHAPALDVKRVDALALVAWLNDSGAALPRASGELG